MPVPLSCPDLQTYRKMLAGDYSDLELLHSLTDHLETCRECVATLRGLQETKELATFTETRGETDRDPRVERLRDRLRRLVVPFASLNKVSLKPNGPEAEVALLLAPARADDELGRLQRFRILRVLGGGGMGIVLLAEDTLLPRKVAIKIMRPTLAVSAEARRRFEAEARALATLEHDHIVPIWHVDEERGVPFLVMPLLRGQTLEARLKCQGKLPLAECLRIARETTLGLAAAHARGIIHRDVKPANIWLEERGDDAASAPIPRTKLLDFGLVRALTAEDGFTMQGMILGTPGYMSPEQIAGNATFASDLFGLGCVLYRMATGREAFPGKNAMDRLRATEERKPPAPRQLDPALPCAFSDLIDRLLAKTATQRPASAERVLHELDALAAAPTAPDVEPKVLSLPHSLATLPPTLPMPLCGRRAGRSGRRTLLAITTAAALALLLAAYHWFPSRGMLPSKLNDQNDNPSGVGLRRNLDTPILPGGVRFRLETVVPRGRVSALAFRPGTHDLAAASEDGVVRIWDAVTGKLRHVFVPAVALGCLL